MAAREFTVPEIQEKFIKHVRALVDYWDELPKKLTHERLEGMAFSILSMLDGECLDLPGFLLVPNPHPSDKQYCIDKGENYFPQPPEDSDLVDIGGALHELFYGA